MSYNIDWRKFNIGYSVHFNFSIVLYGKKYSFNLQLCFETKSSKTLFFMAVLLVPYLGWGRKVSKTTRFFSWIALLRRYIQEACQVNSLEWCLKKHAQIIITRIIVITSAFQIRDYQRFGDFYSLSKKGCNFGMKHANFILFLGKYPWRSLISGNTNEFVSREFLFLSHAWPKFHKILIL